MVKESDLENTSMVTSAMAQRRWKPAMPLGNAADGCPALAGRRSSHQFSWDRASRNDDMPVFDFARVPGRR
jgi:hypothetical protein